MPPSDLEQRLRDERALRAAVEQRLGEEVEKTRIWRTRAEERAAVITRLRRRPWDRFLRKTASAGPPAPAVPSATRLAVATPTFPSVRLGAITGHPGVTPLTSTAASFDPLTDRVALEAADLVLVDDIGWEAVSSVDRIRFEEWARSSPRAPLVLWATGSGRFAGLEDVDSIRLALPSLAGGDGATATAATFDPADPGGVVGAVAVTAEALRIPDLDLVRLAAAGSPVRLGEDSVDDDRAGAAARRWAYRHHSPWVRLGQIAALADVDLPPVLPSVGAVLVSNRPERVEAALAGLGVQTYPRLEIVLGLHGFDLPDVESRLESSGRPFRVLRFGAEVTLGRCLNAAIETTGADCIAKIDDDDHYGPGYVEDQVSALMASGAGMVGKASVYTFLEDHAQTILRRPGNEHRLIPGTVGGASMVFRRAVWERARFPHRSRFVDTRFIEAARRSGESLFSSSRFEFCVVRHGSGHTYDASTDILTAGAQPAWAGFRPDLVDVPDLVSGPG